MLARKLLNLLVPTSSIPANILVDLPLRALGNKKHGLDHVISLCLKYTGTRRSSANIYVVFFSLLSMDKFTSSVAELLQLLTGTPWRVRG